MRNEYAPRWEAEGMSWRDKVQTGKNEILTYKPLTNNAVKKKYLKIIIKEQQ